jgi:hypothetical protein
MALSLRNSALNLIHSRLTAAVACISLYPTSGTNCTVLAVLVGLQTMPLNYSQAFIADYTVGIAIVLLQTVPTLC